MATLCNQGRETNSNERVSLSLAQAIQYQSNHIPNQTTLGIGVRMHHRFGSKELISLLSSYGICISYDEVLRFRQSAAYYTGNQEILSGNLRRNGGPISAWIDHFDLNMFTPNEMRETHPAIQCSQSDNTDETHVNDPQDPQNLIPRLSKHEVKNLKLSELNPVNIVHFYG